MGIQEEYSELTGFVIEEANKTGRGVTSRRVA